MIEQLPSLARPVGQSITDALGALAQYKLNKITERDLVSTGLTPGQARLYRQAPTYQEKESLLGRYNPAISQGQGQDQYQGQGGGQDIQSILSMLGQRQQGIRSDLGQQGISPQGIQQAETGNYSLLQPQQREQVDQLQQQGQQIGLLQQLQQLLQQRQVMQPEQQMGQGKGQPGGIRLGEIPKYSGATDLAKDARQKELISARKEIREYTEKQKSNRESRKRMEKVLDFYNFDPDEIKFLVESPVEINDDAIDIFLKHNNNDPKKATFMAKKVGFKV